VKTFPCPGIRHGADSERGRDKRQPQNRLKSLFYIMERDPDPLDLCNVIPLPNLRELISRFKRSFILCGKPSLPFGILKIDGVPLCQSVGGHERRAAYSDFTLIDPNLHVGKQDQRMCFLFTDKRGEGRSGNLRGGFCHAISEKERPAELFSRPVKGP
jgi:hypothetical protein